MRKWMLTSIMLFAFMLTACRSNKIQGVEEMDSGKVSVTFQVPEGMTLEEVLGCEIGSENIAYSTNVETGEEFNVYWYEVSTGEIVSSAMGYYRYGPEASVSNTMGVYAPPAWVMLYFAPNEKEALREKDVEKLEEKYGIVLNFGKDSPKDN